MNNIIERWLEKADHDLGTAIIAQKHLPTYKDIIAFHCQQAVEKYLKAFILNLGLPLKKTHDLVFLLEQIDKYDKIEHDWFERVFELQDFAVEIRYPDQVIELSDEDINTAIEIATQFRKLILEKMGLDLAFDDPGNKPGNK